MDTARQNLHTKKVEVKRKRGHWFDSKNHQHSTILSYAIQFGWSIPHPSKAMDIANRDAVLTWLNSDKSPIKEQVKHLGDLKSKDLNKIINALSNMITKKHAKS
ncbi:MAG: hypothetical protein WA775_02900 [Psychroserpens sp.]|uniref:hypothetical protein n=1 Tax=Psychroserpens sp. TaxID=2020870 RepID=UPI003CA76BEF